MAVCVISGTVLDGGGAAVSGASVRIRTIDPVLTSSGAGLATDDLTTTTDALGAWSLTVEQDINAQVDIPAIGVAADIIVPTSSTALFSGLTLYARGTLTPMTVLSDHGPSLGGDLHGASPSPTVVGFAGVPLHGDTVANGKAWVYRSANADYRLESLTPTSGVIAAINASAETPKIAAAQLQDIAQSQVTGLASSLSAKEATANKGQPNGYASLGAGGTVPTGQLPATMTPAAHAASHAAAASDPVTPSAIGAAAASHTHSESQITSLVADLANKANLTGATFSGGVTFNGGFVVVGPHTYTGDAAVTEGNAFHVEMAVPTSPTSTATPGGTLTTGTFYYVVTAMDGVGETIRSAETSVFVGGVNGSVAVGWAASDGAAKYRVYRGTAAGGENVYFETTGTTYNDVGAAGTGATPPVANGAYLSTIGGTGDGWLLGQNVGIGTAAPTVPLEVSGTAKATAFSGPLTGNVTGNVTGSAASITGNLTGDVTSTGMTTAVASVGGQTAANVAAGSVLANAATDANTASTIVRRTAGGNFTAGTVTANLTGNVTGNASGTAATFTGNLSGDVTSTGMTTAVASVGGSTASNVHAAELLANAAASAATPSTIVKRDGSNNFAAGTITANLTGNASGSAASFTGSLVGDVTGTQGATTVALVSGASAATVAAGAALANAATDANTASRIVKRDAGGAFSAGTITANLTGNASGSAATFTGNLSGDVTGTQGATVVSTVSGVTAANVAAGATLANAATAANTASAILKRDGAGQVASTTFTGALAGNATTASDGVTSAAGTAPLTLALAAKALTGSVATFGAAQAGVVPLSGGGTANFLRADGTWTAPPQGTVTSVAATVPTEFAISGSPVTTTGTLAITKAVQNANKVWAGPTTGADAQPAFRSLVAADFPVMVGDAGAGGAKGAVPAPATGDASKFLTGAGTWGTPTGVLSGLSAGQLVIASGATSAVTDPGLTFTTGAGGTLTTAGSIQGRVVTATGSGASLNARNPGNFNGLTIEETGSSNVGVTAGCNAAGDGFLYVGRTGSAPGSVAKIGNWPTASTIAAEFTQPTAGDAVSAIASGTTGTNRGVVSTVAGSGATANYGVQIAASGATTNRGLVIDSAKPPAGATNHAIYSASEAQSYVAGKLGVGVATPVGNIDSAITGTSVLAGKFFATGSTSIAEGVYAQANGSGINMYGVLAEAIGSGANSDNRGLSASASGGLKNAGIEITGPVAGADNYAIKSTAAAKSYFAGSIGVATTTPEVAVDVAGAVQARGMAAPAVSSAGNGRIYFDSTRKRWRISENGGAYIDLAGVAGVSGSGATGQVTVWSAGNALTSDSALLYDTANNYLGVNAAADEILHVGGAAILDAVAAPGSPVAGHLWTDSTQKAIHSYQAAVKQALAGVVFTQTADAVIANTSTETTLVGTGVGTATLPVNALVAGKTIRVSFSAFAGPAIPGGSPAVTVRVKLGTVTLCSTTISLVGLSDGIVTGTALLTCRTVGAGGTVFGTGRLEYGLASADAKSRALSSIAAATVDTTATQLVNVTAQFAAGTAAGDILTGSHCVIEILN